MLAVLLLLSGAGIGSAEKAMPPTPPVYECIRALEKPVIDGDLSDPIWEEAQEVRLLDAATGAAPKQATVARVIWDDDYLYAAARVCETDILDHNTKRQDLVFMEQAFELYLMAPLGMPTENGTPWRYLEVDVSPKGVVWLGRQTNWRSRIKQEGGGYDFFSDESYDSPDLQIKTSIAGEVNNPQVVSKGWRVEMRIPWGAVPWAGRPVPGEMWPMNLNRVRNMGKPDQEFTTWATLGTTNFHAPWRFGLLKFVGAPERPTIIPWTINW